MTQLEPDLTKPKDPDKSLGDLFGDLSQEFGELVRAQTELAKTELRAQADKAKTAAGAFGAAAAVGYTALLLLSFAAAWGLSEVVPEGVAFLIVGIVFAVVAIALFLWARNRIREFDAVPQDTVESLKEDVEWARQKIS